MPGIPASNRSQILEFLAQRLEGTPLLLSACTSVKSLQVAFDEFAGCNAMPDQLPLAEMFRQVSAREELIGLPIAENRCLVGASIPCDQGPAMVLISVLDCCDKIGLCLVRNAVEAWCMHQELDSSRKALVESAMQLAQSFEEQNWLRGFARNASSFSRLRCANDVASGILQPLGYLLRAQDVFLVVDAEESSRSGLVDAKYGQSNFSLSGIRKLLCELSLGPDSIPLVRNNIELLVEDGFVRSIIAVNVGSSERHLGHLIGINRSTEATDDSLPVYDPEFGSGDVGLLEEAAVLLSTQAHNIQLLVQSNQLCLGTLHAMSSAIDARDKYTQGHSERVARLSFDLSQIYGLTDEACQEIYLSGILHDIGKIGIPDSVLLKAGALTEDEFKIIQLHPEIGYRIVQQLGHLQFVLPGILYHHERWDGRGYPHGLRAESIPIMARIMAVADAFDAMTSSRPYRSAMPVQKAHQIINAGAGQQWDSRVVECYNIWLNQRASDDVPLAIPQQSIIPQDSPFEHMVQAVMTLGL